MKRRRAWLSILIALSIAGAAAAQPPAGEASDEIRVHIVNVDVFVADRKGVPIEGLAKEDFRLFEDGRPVEIRNFAEIRGLSAPPGDPSEGPSGDPESRPTRLPIIAGGDDPALLVLYIDNTTLLPNHRNRVLSDLEAFLSGPELAGRRIMVVTNNPGLELSAGPTRDLDEIKVVLERAAKKTARGIETRAERASAYQTVADIYRCYAGGPCLGGPCDAGWGEMLAVMQGFAQSIQGRVAIAQAGLTDLVRSLAGFPGRKEIVYLSDGFAREPGLADFGFLGELCPAREREIWTASSQFGQTAALKRIAAFANANGVTIHALEAAGLSTPSIASVEWDDRRFTPSPRIDDLERANLQGSLFTLADETGGVAIFNANRPLADLEKLARGSASFYSLGFSPDHLGDGEIHQLQVGLRKEAAKGATLRYRRRYRDTPEEERMAERALATLLFGLEENPLGARAWFADGAETAGDAGHVPLEIEIPVAHLATVHKGGSEQGVLRLVIIATDDKGASTVREKPHSFVLAEPSADEAAYQRLVIDMELEPGAHLLGIGIRDELAGTTSYLRAEIEIGKKGRKR